jgi:hypothetical protein
MTIDTVHQPDDNSLDIKRLIRRASAEMNKLSKWLTPISTLDSEKCSAFGRNIERKLNALDNHKGVMKLELRKHDTAVVISIEHYKAILEMKETFSQLLATERDNIIAEAAGDYEALYRHITSPQSRKAADALFSANSDDLKETFRPGKTESK